MTQLDQLLSKYPFQRRQLPSDQPIEALQSYITFPLPEDYKYYLANYSEYEDFIGPEFVRLWRLEELMEQNKGYGIIENLSYTLAIGSNGSGEFIAIEKTGENAYRVVLSPLIDLNKEYHVEIGNSFTDFIQRLDRGMEWFD